METRKNYASGGIHYAFIESFLDGINLSFLSVYNNVITWGDEFQKFMSQYISKICFSFNILSHVQRPEIIVSEQFY